MNTGNKGLFRRESMERISSPEQLNEYMKVTNPPVWLVFFGVIVFLCGVLVWAVGGHLDMEISAAAEVTDQTAIVYLPSGKDAVHIGMPVIISHQEYEVSEVHSSRRKVDGRFNRDVKAIGSFEQGEILDEIVVPCTLPDGVYPAKIVTERISPIRLIFN